MYEYSLPNNFEPGNFYWVWMLHNLKYPKDECVLDFPSSNDMKWSLVIQMDAFFSMKKEVLHNSFSTCVHYEKDIRADSKYAF